MYIYTGKLNWLHYAVDECFTVVLPGGFAVDAPVCAFFQWTKDAADKSKANYPMTGYINSAYHVGNEHKFSFYLDRTYYPFDAVIQENGKKLQVTLRDPADGRDALPTTLTRCFEDSSLSSQPQIYIGKLDFFHWAVDEMVTVVLPTGVHDGSSVCVFYQWTESAAGEKNANKLAISTLGGASITADGISTASFQDYYTYTVKVSKSDDKLILDMEAPGQRDKKAPYTLKRVRY